MLQLSFAALSIKHLEKCRSRLIALIGLNVVIARFIRHNIFLFPIFWNVKCYIILFLLLNWILFIIVKWHNPTKDLFFFVLRLQVLCLPSSCFDSLVFRKCLVHDNERHAKSKQFTLDRLVWCIWTFLTKKYSCVSKILLYEAFVYTLIKRNVSRTQKGVLYSPFYFLKSV